MRCATHPSCVSSLNSAVRSLTAFFCHPAARQGCDVSFLAKLENSVVAYGLSQLGETWWHAVD